MRVLQTVSGFRTAMLMLDVHHATLALSLLYLQRDTAFVSLVTHLVGVTGMLADV